MERTIELSPSDRTVFADCPNCNRRGNGQKVNNIFCMAYTKRQWARKPKCDNCDTDMRFLYEVGVE